MKTFRITVRKPAPAFQKAETKTFFRNAESKSQLKRESMICNSSGVFTSFTIEEIAFDADIKGIESSEF